MKKSAAPFKVTQSSITRLWVVQGPDGELRAGYNTEEEARLDARRLNAAWLMGYTQKEDEK